MNDTLIHADIFFFITTIAVILFTILAIIILVYVVGIVRSFSYIAKRLQKESDQVADDIAEIRERVKTEGEKVSNLWKFATGFFFNKFTSKFTSSSKSRQNSRSESSSESRSGSRSGRSKKATHSTESEE